MILVKIPCRPKRMPAAIMASIEKSEAKVRNNDRLSVKNCLEWAYGRPVELIVESDSAEYEVGTVFISRLGTVRAVASARDGGNLIPSDCSGKVWSVVETGAPEAENRLHGSRLIKSDRIIYVVDKNMLREARRKLTGHVNSVGRTMIPARNDEEAIGVLGGKSGKSHTLRCSEEVHMIKHVLNIDLEKHLAEKP